MVHQNAEPVFSGDKAIFVDNTSRIENTENFENTKITQSKSPVIELEEFNIEGERRSRMEPDGARNPSPDNITTINP